MNDLYHLKNEARQIRLSAEEKALMRANIFKQSPARSMESPYTAISHYHWFSARFATALAACAVVVLGGGTVYAAQAALPGDVLYPVKVGVAEPVRAALAFSTEAKVAVYADIAAERLEEAQELAAAGRLSAEAAAKIEQSLDAHLEEAEMLAVQMKAEDPESAEEASLALDATLSVHSVILATLGNESEDNDTKEYARSLARKTQTRVAYTRASAGGAGDASATLAITAPMAAEDENADSFTESKTSAESAAPAPVALSAASEVQKKASEVMKTKAEAELAAAKKLFGAIEQALGASTTARAQAEFEVLEERMNGGIAVEAAGDYRAARDVYLSVYKDALALSGFLKAERRFNKHILDSLINERFGTRAVDFRSTHEMEKDIPKKDVSKATDREGIESEKREEKDDEEQKKEELPTGKRDGSNGSIQVDTDLGL